MCQLQPRCVNYNVVNYVELDGHKHADSGGGDGLTACQAAAYMCAGAGKPGAGSGSGSAGSGGGATRDLTISSPGLHQFTHIFDPIINSAASATRAVMRERAAFGAWCAQHEVKCAVVTALAARGGGVRPGAAGSRFRVDGSGAATVRVRSEAGWVDVSDHAALRMTQRNISIDAVEETLRQQAFGYYHQNTWKTGYYNTKTKVFAGISDGEVATVIKANQNYINNLKRARP